MSPWRSKSIGPWIARIACPMCHAKTRLSRGDARKGGTKGAVLRAPNPMSWNQKRSTTETGRGQVMERALREAIGQTRKIKKQILRSSRPGWNFEALSAEKAETAERTILCSLFQNLCASAPLRLCGGFNAQLLVFRLQMELLIANTGQIQWERAQLLVFIDSCNFVFNENNKKCRRAVKRIARILDFARKTDICPTPVGN